MAHCSLHRYEIIKNDLLVKKKSLRTSKKSVSQYPPTMGRLHSKEITFRSLQFYKTDTPVANTYI